MTYDQAVKLYGCPAALSIATGVDRSTVAKWKARDAIPREHQLELLLLLTAPGTHDAERDALRRSVLRRHKHAVRYLHKNRPDLLARIPFHALAPIPPRQQQRREA